MKLNNEVKETFYRYNTDMTNDEYNMLLEYANEYLTLKELDDFAVNWAIVDILTKQLKGKKVKKCLKKTSKKK